MKLTLGSITNLDLLFLPALDRLGEQQITVKDKWAIARTRKEIVAQLETYQEQYNALVKGLGKPQLEAINAHIELIKSNPDPSPEVIAYWNRKRDEATGSKPVWIVPQSDTDGQAKLRAGVDELNKIEFDVFLDHKIVIPDDSNLTSREMAALVEIIDVKC